MNDRHKRLRKLRMTAKYGGLTPDADLSTPISDAEIAAFEDAARRAGVGDNMIRDQVASWRKTQREEVDRVMAQIFEEHAAYEDAPKSPQ